MPFEIVRNDITAMYVDAIVNTANPNPVIGAGTDCAVHQAAGPELLAARKKIGPIAVGHAALTPAYGLPSRVVIHTVGPIWNDGQHQEPALLAQCYRSALALAKENGCESIAFPLISTGSYGFPHELALEIAVNTCREYLQQQEMDIYLVVFHPDSYRISKEKYQAVAAFVDENYVGAAFQFEYNALEITATLNSSEIRREAALYQAQKAPSPAPVQASKAEPPEKKAPKRKLSFFQKKQPTPTKFSVSSAPAPMEGPAAPSPVPTFNRSLADLVNHLEEDFAHHLFRLIDERGLKDPDVYKRANIDRKLFSKIRSNPAYKPSKSTAIALALALRLSLDETKDLIGRAGYSLTRSSKMDVIIEYYILHEIYDIYEVNEALFAFEQPLLGS